MKGKTLLWALLPFLLTGCSTISPPSAVNSLQIKVAHLERRLAQKEEDLERLKAKVQILEDEVVGQVQGFEQPSESNSAPAETDYVAQVKQEEEERIIRVQASVKDVQRALASSGFYSDTIDGKLGANTKQGILDFQKAHDLKADGIVGSQTWTALKSYLN